MTDVPSTTPPPNPQNNSLLTSLALGAAGIATGYLAENHIIPAADVTTDTAMIGAFITFALGVGVALYKRAQVSQRAMMKSVNQTNNGVVVVPTVAAISAGIQPVSTPLAGPEAPKGKGQ